MADGTAVSMLTKFVYREPKQAEGKVLELHGAFESILQCKLVQENPSGYQKDVNMSVADTLASLGIVGVDHGVSVLNVEVIEEPRVILS